MSTIYERIEQGLKEIKKDKTEQIKKEVKEEVTHEDWKHLVENWIFGENVKQLLKFGVKI